jgi:hypothetical protein
MRSDVNRAGHLGEKMHRTLIHKLRETDYAREQAA